MRLFLIDAWPSVRPIGPLVNGFRHLSSFTLGRVSVHLIVRPSLSVRLSLHPSLRPSGPNGLGVNGFRHLLSLASSKLFKALSGAKRGSVRVKRDLNKQCESDSLFGYLSDNNSMSRVIDKSFILSATRTIGG